MNTYSEMEVETHVNQLSSGEKKLLTGLYLQDSISLDVHLWDSLTRQNFILTNGALTAKGQIAAQALVAATARSGWADSVQQFLSWFERKTTRSRFNAGV